MRDPFLIRLNQAQIANRVLGMALFTPWNIGQLDSPTLDMLLMNYVDLPAMKAAIKAQQSALEKLRG